MGMRAAGCLDDLAAGIEAAVADVLHQGAMKQLRILWNHRDRSRAILLRDLLNILPIDADAAALWLEQAQHEIDQGALPLPE